MTAGGYGEGELVENPCVDLFGELGWETVNAFHETFVPGGGTNGRESKAEVILLPRLRAALERLNLGLAAQAADVVIEALTRERSAMSAASANSDVYALLKDGVRVSVRAGDEEETTVVRVIDWEEPENNDFLLVSQFWITGEVYTKRADLVGFVNGIPLVFIELKAAHSRVEDAYNKNLRDYRNTIPHAFWYNGLIILSNGSQSRMGSVTAGWEHFASWKKINDEGEAGVISLETMVRATCAKDRLLDLVENFTLFSEEMGGTAKVLAKNHQYLGVDNAVRALANRRAGEGALGVYWHTQGAGKSYSMMFFAQKALRKLPGSPTFVVLTDRKELDEQIYGTFQRAGVVTEGHVQARSSTHLRELLGANHRYIFTLVQKFRTEKGQKHPVVSERSDIIVIADEAHRSQYDTFAANMRDALPNAAFIAFTGTPLMAGEEKTREVFGDYISVYDFEQSVTDESTVPLFYENRIPELQLTNKDLREDIYRVLDDADLGEAEERAVERAFAREYNLITRDDRLETIAEDIVAHFYGRGFPGKAMVVCIDKATAVRMYDKVQKYWQAYIEKQGEPPPTDDFARTTDMAVVVSSSPNEVEDLAQKGADIRPHRARMSREDLAEKFKQPDDPLRIVFVCAMWMTGFDAPSCSTIYLDKPMRNHTLMQTIARANRVFKGKTEGMIVDYIGVFRDLEKALAIYAPGGRDVMPVREKAVLVARLKEAVEKATAFLVDAGVDPAGIMVAEKFAKIALMDAAVEAIVVNEDSKSHFASLVAAADRAHRSVMPDPAAGEYRAIVQLLLVLRGMVRNLAGPVDVSAVMSEIEEILEESVTTEPYTIAEKPGAGAIDLSKLDFKALRKRFAEGRRNSAVEHLKGQIGAKLAQMVRLNRSRLDYLEKFQAMVDEYNAGSVNIQLLFDELLAFTEELAEEDKRYIKEDLTEEELAIFDLLTKPDMELTKKEAKAVKAIARQLLDTLKRERLVLDWRKRQQSRAAVRVCIEENLDLLPGSYGSGKYKEKCNAVYDHVYDSYFGEGKSVYRAA